MTLGEVIRRLDWVSQQLVDLTSKLDSTYVRKDTYEVKDNSQDRAIRDLEDSRRTLSRVAWTGIAVPLLLIIILALSGLGQR